MHHKVSSSQRSSSPLFLFPSCICEDISLQTICYYCNTLEQCLQPTLFAFPSRRMIPESFCMIPLAARKISQILKLPLQWFYWKCLLNDRIMVSLIFTHTKLNRLIVFDLLTSITCYHNNKTLHNTYIGYKHNLKTTFLMLL